MRSHDQRILVLERFMRRWRLGAAFAAVIVAVLPMAALPAFAAAQRGAMTVSVASLSPAMALIAGILILIIPRLLNFIVALYLILVGLIGLFGR